MREELGELVLVQDSRRVEGGGEGRREVGGADSLWYV